MIARQLSSLHPATVVHDGQRSVGAVRLQANERGPGVERVGDDFRQDGLFQRAGVRVAQIFEQMLKVDPGLAHGRILISPWLLNLKSIGTARVIVPAE